MNEPSVKVLNCTVSLDLFYTQLVKPWLNSSELCNLNSMISRVGDNDLVLCVRGHVPGVVELTLPVAPAAKRAQVLAHDGENPEILQFLAVGFQPKCSLSLSKN